MHFSQFAGMRPRVHRTLLKSHEATWAENVNLWHGTIEAYRTPLLVDQRGVPHRTIFQTEAGWIVLRGLDDLVSGLPGCPRVIAFGEDLRVPVWADAADAVAGRWWRLGLPVPPPPIATVSVQPGWAGPSDQRSEYRAYVVTYVDPFGNEGPPSLPSARFGIDDGASALVQWDGPPVCGWDVQAVRLYRLTASDAGAEQIGLPRTEEFHLVGEFPAAIGGVNDALRNLDLGEPLTTMRYAPPPEELTHLVAEPNGAQLAGVVGRDIWFCEPHEFHAWPDAYRLHLDDTIVAMAWTDSGLYVATDGHPYWIASQADEWGGREVFRMPEPMPCVARRSMTTTPGGGALYAGRGGLVLLSGRQCQRVSQAYWSEEDFAALRPETMIAAVHDGLWFGFTENSGWMLDLADPAYPGRQLGLIALSLRPTALHRCRTDALYMALPTGIGQWNAGQTYLPFRYRPRCTVTPGQMNWGAAKVVWDAYPFRGSWSDARPSTGFRLWADDRVIYERELRHSGPFRLPHACRQMRFEVEILRDEAPWRGAIAEVAIGSSVSALGET